ncbi:MAG: DUF1080 domain-containing protein [Daejeonella sp.]|uniref:3-keto-disaccharide hydrolase n=1 Tax=Daejeonella sp. TaxID=2805397 RepID=UPI003C720160
MKYLIFILSIFIFFTTSCQSYKPIFNGQDLSGWKIHGTEKWYVDNGELVCESGPEKKYGYLSTDKKYKNFVLDLDFKLVANGNSGVFIRSNVQGTTIQGWQVEVAPAGLHTGGIYESYGREWLIKPGSEEEKKLNPNGWNHMRIDVRGDNVNTYLNGTKMVSLNDSKVGAGEGSIALQIHSGGGINVRWKNLRIKELR